MKLVFENKKRINEEYRQYALVDEYDWDHKFGPDLFTSAEEAKEWGRNYLRKHPEQETLTLVDITDDENWEELDNIYNESLKRMNEDSSKEETKELDYYEDVYDLDALYDHMTVCVGKRGKFTPEINLGAGAISIGEARKLANNLLKVCDDAEKLSNKYKNNMKQG